MTVLLDDVERGRAQRRCEVNEIVYGDALSIERRRFRRKRLRRRRLLTGRLRLRHRTIFDRPHRLARSPVEHEGKRLFRQLHDGPDPTAIDCDVRQNRRGWQIVVPQVVTHELVVPHAFPRLALDADQRVRK